MHFFILPYEKNTKLVKVEKKKNRKNCENSNLTNVLQIPVLSLSYEATGRSVVRFVFMINVIKRELDNC